MLLTLKDVAELLNITPNMVARLCRAKKLQANRYSHIWLVDPAAVEAYQALPKNKGGRPRKIKTPESPEIEKPALPVDTE